MTHKRGPRGGLVDDETGTEAVDFKVFARENPAQAKAYMALVELPPLDRLSCATNLMNSVVRTVVPEAREKLARSIAETLLNCLVGSLGIQAEMDATTEEAPCVLCGEGTTVEVDGEEVAGESERSRVPMCAPCITQTHRPHGKTGSA